MDADIKRDIEDLKRELKSYESEEAQLLADLENLRGKMTAVKEKLKTLSNDNQYQQNMLELVYQQRHGVSAKPKE